MNQNNKFKGVFIYLAVIVLLVIGMVTMLQMSATPGERTRYSQVISEFDNYNVSGYTLDLGSGELQYTLKSDSTKKYKYSVPNVSLFLQDTEGYRKALRLAYQAEKFHRPVICFVDTPGAFCGVEAEKRGQGEAIAKNIAEFMTLKTPVISVVLGEGGSGGALALAVANRVLMLEHAVYSVLSPEGLASILWKDASRSGEACEMMKLTAQDLYRGGIVEEVIPEPVGGAQRCHAALFERMDAALRAHLKELCRMSDRQLADQRYKKYRQIGETRNP